MNNLVLSSVPYSGWTSTIDGIVSERALVLRPPVIYSNKLPTETPDPATDNVVTCLKGADKMSILFIAFYLTALAYSFQPCGSGGFMKLGHVWTRPRTSRFISRVISTFRYVCYLESSLDLIET